MKKRLFVAALLLVAGAMLCAPRSPAYADAVRPSSTSSACSIPTDLPDGAHSLEHLAWQLFVAANCASGNPGLPLAWETWPEQTCLTSGGRDCAGKAGRQRLHASVLAAKGRDLPALCQEMTTEKNAIDSAFLPFIPKNLSSNPLFCEEVHVNQAEADFITSPPGRNIKYSLQTLPGQRDFIRSNGPLSLPSSAIEVKADWLPSTSINPAFTCDKISNEFYVEKIGDECYALVGLHFTSKVRPNWVWATFEPQSTATNPNRCNPKLYSNCSDQWGSLSSSTGGKTGMTEDLRTLMDAAALRRAFYNYRLVGVQADYVDSDGKAIRLGNSFTEFNAQVLPQQSSCITCHSYASFTSNANPIVENPNFGAFPGTPAIGKPAALDGWSRQDFSWLLGIMPPNGTVGAGTSGKK
ncbi:hypothetical protein WKR88_29025 [Trinickia caryophylli]|uniref:Cytochrome c domain-containing protein n=1 Tax=Trinickia caryophylli TaxID=28094 RepID=A0A1X7H2S5_TRICW|nr:hypothetical protein [Trinickia caryophylli]PMS10046.1 hypothetical protein C0Z17_22320 [Trinickia caryophylli]TRX18403.1 hypothetical protein FNF07_09350 [Trinickia caryophylli]WQE10814.1 hypothetical protein U0034_13580 [Trinickia caryophylli]SMF78651.1 hypothetical protein SAMN06295900_120124 [Trinickia caryophylli]